MGNVWSGLMYVFDNATDTSLSRPQNIDSVVVARTTSSLEFAQIYTAAASQSRNVVVCMTCNYRTNFHYMHIAWCLEIQYGYHSVRRPDAKCCKFGQVCGEILRWSATVEESRGRFLAEQSEVCISIIVMNIELITIPVSHQARMLMHTRRRWIASASASSQFMMDFSQVRL